MVKDDLNAAVAALLDGIDGNCHLKEMVTGCSKALEETIAAHIAELTARKRGWVERLAASPGYPVARS